jgi:hypothetical protein
VKRRRWPISIDGLRKAASDVRKKADAISFLPIFKLHIWLWQNNPSGTFADWNPKVSCQHAESSETF